MAVHVGGIREIVFPPFDGVSIMRPSPCRQVQPSLRALASSSGTKSSSKPLVRRTDELAKRLDIAKIAPHAWNDVPSPAHLQLEAERERRHFARLVALDLPQLKGRSL